MSNERPTQRFTETVRLPRRFLRLWLAFNVTATLFFAWLWYVARMSGTQRVGTAAFVVFVLVLFWGGALWFVAAHVVVSGDQLTKRVGHRRTRTDLSEIAATRVEGGGLALSKVVFTLRDGTEREIPTRRPADLCRAVMPEAML